MTKRLGILLMLLLSFVLCGCEPDDKVPYMPKVIWSTANTESPANINHLYWKDIEVRVVDVEHTSRKSGSVRRKCTTITVYSDEYNLTFTESYFGTGDIFDMRVGDIVWAELYTWKNDATGEINRREINRVYQDQSSLSY